MIILLLNFLTAAILFGVGIWCVKASRQQPGSNFGYRYKGCMNNPEKWRLSNLLAGIFSIVAAIIFFTLMPVIIALYNKQNAIQIICYFLSSVIIIPILVFVPGRIASRKK